MYSPSRLLSFLLLMLTLLAGCDAAQPTENRAPQLTLLEPLQGATFTQDEPIDVLAEASDPDGNLSHVTFYVDGAEVAEDDTAPYAHTFFPTSDKAYILAAEAQDAAGAQSSLLSVTVQVESAKSVYNLTLEIGGQGSVTSTPAGLACSTTCRAEFETGQNVSLTAVPTEGSSFVKWEGACSGTDNLCELAPADVGEVRVSATFQTVAPPPPPPNSVKVAAAGDIACGDYSPTGPDKCHDQQTADLVTNLDPDLVLLLGDTQYDPPTYQDFLDHYDKSWGAFKTFTHPAVGNHEYNRRTPNAEGYFEYFGAAAGDPTKGYYSFDTGDWHVVMLNTNDECTVIACAAGSEQERWLRDDLAASDTRCTLAVMHHPRYNSGNHGNAMVTQGLWQALVEADADLVLSGHAHHYERFAPQDAGGTLDSEQGLRSFVVGTGGKSLDESGAPIKNSERIIDAYGVLELTLNSDSYEWRFVPEAGGAAADSGSDTCH